MYGSDVSCLKQLLANKGYLVNNNFDNYFDYETRNAVLLFQQNNYLGADGVVGFVLAVIFIKDIKINLKITSLNL